MRDEIIIGDSFAVLPTLQSESIDYCLTSPPYDSMRDYDGFPLLDKERRIELGRQMYRLLKPGSVCSVVIGDQTVGNAESLTSFRWALEWVEACDFKLFETLIYSRHPTPGKRVGFATEHEYVFNFLKGDRPRTINKEHLQVRNKTHAAGKQWAKQQRKGDKWHYSEGTFGIPETRDRGTIWRYNASCAEGNRLKLQHHATMPDALAADLIRCFSNEKETVLDCFAGSGTTLVCAKKWRRHYCGIEISPKFAAICRKRLEVEITEDIFAEEG